MNNLTAEIEVEWGRSGMKLNKISCEATTTMPGTGIHLAGNE